MKAGTRRFTALLCAFCMLFTSIPSSVMSDSLTEEIQVTTATPTDLQPVETEETVTSPETEDEVPELPQADKELEAGDDLTVTGELTETKKESLIRFSPEKNQTMVLVLTADKELKATVQNENTGDRETFEKDHTDEDGTTTWIVADYKTEKENTYLLRISGEEPAEFTLRLVRKSLFEQEQETEEPAGEPTDEPGDDLSEQSVDEPVKEDGDVAEKELTEESGKQTTGETTEEPAEEPAETPDGQTAGGTTDKSTDDTTEETDQPETSETTGDENTDKLEPEPEKEKPVADREITAGDDVTVSGEMNSSGEYLIRFTPDMDLTLYLILTAENAQATVTDEQTDSTKQFTPDNTVEEEQTVLTVPFYKIKNSNSYLIRISGTGDFTVRLVRSSILKAEANRQDEPEETADPETDPEEDAEENPADQLEENLAEAVEGSQTEEPEENLVEFEANPTEETEENPTETEPEEPEEIPTEEPEEIPTEEPEENPAETEQKEFEEETVEEPTEEPAAEPEGTPEEPETEPETALGMTEEPEAEPEQAEEEIPVTPAAQAEPEVTSEAETPATQTDLESVKAETPATQTDLEPVEEETPATQTDLEPVEEEPVEVRIDATDSDIEAYILFLSNAGIPEGTELQVRELTPEEQGAYQAQTAQALNAEDESYLRYTKYLEFTLVHDGWAIPLNAPAKVYVTLPDINEGADALQVVRFDNMMPVLLDSERTENTVSFETEGFDVFGIGNALVPVTDHETELVKVEVLSFAEDAPVNLAEAEAPEVIEGLEVLGTFTIEDNTEATPEAETQDGLFIKAELKEDAELDPMEGVALYSVDEDGNTEILMEELTGDAKITELEATQVAVIKDTGYRHLTLTVNPDETTDDQIVTLDGMMPKDAEAAVVDVTEAHAAANDMEIADCSWADETLTENEDASDTEELTEYAETQPDTGSEQMDHTSEEMAEEEPQVSAGEATEGPKVKLIAAYDISILNGTEEYQPEEDRPISVEILDSRITAGRSIELWHIKDDGTQEQIFDFILEEGRIYFEAKGFSAYAIVEGPVPGETLGGVTVISDMQSLVAQINQGRGLYIDGVQYPGHYFMDKEINTDGTTNSGGRRGIKKVKPSVTSPLVANNEGETATLYYFEPVNEENRQYKLYCKSESSTKYIKQESKSLKLVAEANATTFTLDIETCDGDSSHKDKQFTGFVIYNSETNFYCTMQGGLGGSTYAAYDSCDANCLFRFLYENTIPEEMYGLDGKSFGLMNWTGGVTGKAMISSIGGTANTLEAMVLTVMAHREDQSVKLFVPKNSEITMWTFEWVQNDKYYLKTNISGTTKYLTITNEGLSLSENPSEIQVIPGSGTHAGQITLKNGGQILTYSGSSETGFNTGGSAGNEYLYLVEESELTEEYFLVYSADKVSVSDPAVTHGTKVIVYTRFWNEDDSKYEFYAVDYDGSLVPVYESGDVIQWIGNPLNTMLWSFVEYYWEGTNEPNNYYELYNEYSEKFIAPQLTGMQTLSDNTIGINMNGRRDNAYFSSILAWDGNSYAFAGLKVAEGADGKKHLEACPKSQAADFYFAIVQDTPIEDSVNGTIQTIDNTLYGITMKIIDLENTNNNKQMDDFLGNHAAGVTGSTLQQGILSTNLGDDGYPTVVNNSNSSLGGLYSEAQVVNHLFIASTYYSSGYYEFDSSQNYAYLNANNNFTVYQELGTHDKESKVTLKHGQFFPFNNITAGDFAVLNPYNLYPPTTYSANGAQLSDDNPRKNEKLYLIRNPDYYFAMELEASFTQTPNGKDAWDHDIIYEFTGDDDFWLYVDGELIIDLGGKHSAVPGTVNYSTGRVSVNGKSTMTLNGRTVEMNLRNIFESNFRKRNPNADQAAVDEFLGKYFDEGSTIFREFTSHTMRIFYMERGAGASNLHMRFNLASVREGHVMLSKILEGVDASESHLVEYPYQIYYRVHDYDPWSLMEEKDNSNEHKYQVFYADTEKPVTFKEEITIDGISYRNVFILKPGETADIKVPVDTTEYYIVECGLNREVYTADDNTIGVVVKEIERDELTEDRPSSTISDFRTNADSVKERPRITYINTVNPNKLGTLTITKNLYEPQSDGSYSKLRYVDDSQEFEFRLYLKSALSELKEDDYASMHTYHVKDEEGYYCYWSTETQKFVRHPSEIRDYTTVTDVTIKEALTLNTSIYGAVASIPNEYTIEVRDLMPGMQYKVVERPKDMPDGYTLWRYWINEGNSNPNYINDATTGISSTIEIGNNEEVRVDNLKGWGMRVTKEWTDADYMKERSDTYFAIYSHYNQNDSTQETIIQDTVKQMQNGETTLYWYFNVLPDANVAQNLDNYVIREVELINATINDSGSLTYAGVKKLDDNGSLTLSGKMIHQSSATDIQYTVHYTDREKIGNNLLVQTVVNDRPGIDIYKTDWNETPLAGAEFKLTMSVQDGTVVEFGPYVSDNQGKVTTAYLLPDTDYTLTESDAPRGYFGLQDPLTIRQAIDQTVTVSAVQEETDKVYVEQATANSNAKISIKNKKMTFRVVKKGGQDFDSAEPIEGVRFALYKEKTVNGVTAIDLIPMAGFAELYSNDQGIVPTVNETLKHGTYELHEKAVPEGYQSMSLPHIKFTIHHTGEVTLDKEITGVRLLYDEETYEDKVIYTMEVLNYPATELIITKQVAGRLSREQEFTFKLVSVEKQTYGTQYAWEKKDANGDIIASTSSGDTPLTTKKDENTFTLKHGQSMMIEVPKNKKIVIEEVVGDSDEFRTSWITDEETPQSGDTAIIQVKLAENATITVTNTLPTEGDIVAPTGVFYRHPPYILILTFGTLLLIMSGFGIAKRKRKEPDVFDSGQGRQSARNGPNARGDPKGIPRGRGVPPCPRTNLWIQPEGSPGERGDLAG